MALGPYRPRPQPKDRGPWPLSLPEGSDLFPIGLWQGSLKSSSTPGPMPSRPQRWQSLRGAAARAAVRGAGPTAAGRGSSVGSAGRGERRRGERRRRSWLCARPCSHAKAAAPTTLARAVFLSAGCRATAGCAGPDGGVKACKRAARSGVRVG